MRSPVSDEIGLARKPDDDLVGCRISRNRIARRRVARQRMKFGMVEAHDRRPAADQLAGESGARRRTIDEYGIEHPWQAVPASRFDGNRGRLPPLAIEGAEIDQEPLRTGHERPISSADSVIEGMQPAASNTLAVKFCATALVMQ